jgi:hypothetical protein
VAQPRGDSNSAPRHAFENGMVYCNVCRLVALRAPGA